MLPHPFLGIQAVLRLRNTEVLRIGKEYLGCCHAVRGIAVQSQITLGLDWLRLKFASEGNGRDERWLTIKKLYCLRRIGGYTLMRKDGTGRAARGKELTGRFTYSGASRGCQ